MKGKSKYVLSKIDGKEYCKTNGKFSQYLASHNLTEEEYFSTYIGDRRYCYCGKVCTFENHKWSYLPTCGDRKCVGLEIAKSISLQSIEKKKEIGQRKSVVFKTYYRSPKGIKTKERIKKALSKEGVQDSAKEKRRKTSMLRYNDPTYSNSQSASETKYKWDPNRRTKIYEKVISTKRTKYDGLMYSEEGLKKIQQLKESGHWKEIRKKCELTWTEKYGVPYFPKSPFIGNTSKPQRKFCDFLHTEIGGNSQYVGGELRIERFHYDYVFNKKIIEFNGDYWHASPRVYFPDSIVSLPHGKKVKAEDIWEKDKKKINLAISNGYQVKIIWEYDFVRDQSKCIQECIKWLQE
jgi:hypothetical protein